MRRPRLKPDPSIYHCISRVAGNAWLLGTREKEFLRNQMWKLAQYCGLLIITYTLMSNHYHIVIRVPEKREVSDAELLQNYRLVHSKLNPQQERALSAVEADMARNGDLARAWRERQLRQMFDISMFNKLLKMRFSIWYNRANDRFGTFWSDRFKSLIVQAGAGLTNTSAYVDLNCVRARMVTDPKDYRFCGYAEAVAGNEKARAGLCEAFGADWEETARRYRCLLFGTLSDMREQKAPLDAAALEEFVKSGGTLPLHVVIRCRIRYFVDGVVLGSEEFVREKASGLSVQTPRVPQPLLPIADWSGLHVLSRMRGRVWAHS